MFTFPVCHFGDNGSIFLDSIVSNMELELDATEITSYSGSGQTWANIISSPDSGAGKTDNNFHLGADSGSSTDDPTFNVDRFDLDGGDFFTHTVDTTFMNAINLTTSGGVTLIFVFDIGSTLDDSTIFASDLFTGGGLSFQVEPDGDIRPAQRSGGAGSLNELAIGFSADTTDNVLIINVDYGSDSIDVYLNSKTPVSNSSMSYDTTDTQDSSGLSATLGANSNATDHLANGWAIKHFAIRTKESTDAEIESMIDNLSDRGLISPIS